MPVFGLNNGMIPIISYNYGARKKKRLQKAMRYGIFYAVGIMLVGLIIMQAIPEQLLQIFHASSYMMQIGVPAIRIISLSFLCAGFGIAGSSIFQAFGKGFLSMLVSIARQLLVLVPVAYLLSRLGRVELVWWAFPIAEIIAVIMTVCFLVHINRTIVHPMEEMPE